MPNIAELQNDLPTLDDKLEWRAEVARIHRRILTCSAPHVLGVHGEWGSGKTSFMRQVQFSLGGEMPSDASVDSASAPFDAAAKAALQEQVEHSRREIDRLREDLNRARDEALIDPLSLVFNRKGFDQRVQALLDTPVTPGRVHCLVMMDIDRFKLVNDTHGHVMGDRILQAVAEVMRTTVTDSSYSVARYGGEEFAILLPQSTLDTAMALAEKVRQRVADMKIRDRRTQHVVLTVTISGGVAAMASGDDASSLVARADKLLYAAKAAGRDRVHRT